MIQLNYRDAKPIYEQIKEGIRRLVVSGTVEPDEKLPSVRELASKLAINPNTISRAYRDLEAEGYLYSVGGRGTFASAHKQVQDYRTEELLKKLDEVVEELCYLSVSPEVLRAHIDNIAAGEEDK